MSRKSSPANEGIVNSGKRNVQAAGKTNYAQSKWNVSYVSGMDKVPGGMTFNNGICNTGDGNVQAAGETHFGSSQCPFARAFGICLGFFGLKMSCKSSPANEGIVNSGNGNVQTTGKINYAESRCIGSASTSGMDKVPGGRIVKPADTKGIFNTGHGNVQAAGETHFGSSQWTIKMD